VGYIHRTRKALEPTEKSKLGMGDKDPNAPTEKKEKKNGSQPGSQLKSQEAGGARRLKGVLPNLKPGAPNPPTEKINEITGSQVLETKRRLHQSQINSTHYPTRSKELLANGAGNPITARQVNLGKRKSKGA